MRNRTDASKNDVLAERLAVLSKCYSTGYFDELFPFLAEDCVFETQWRDDPDVGKEAVMTYFTEKGKTLREYNACPECDLIQYVGDSNPIHNADMLFNGVQQFHGTFIMMYEPNKLALRMRQKYADRDNCVIVDLTLDDQNEISRIDLCMPELYRYKIIGVWRGNKE